MIKAILFDIDGVLVDSFRANLRFYQDLFSVAGYKRPTKKDFQHMYHHTMFDVIKILTGCDDEEARRVLEIGKGSAVPYRKDLMDTPEGMVETVKKLGQTYRLGIVTSRVRRGELWFPHGNDIEKLMSVIVTYDDTEKHKPDPEPLLFAAQKLHVSPKECMYVGDQPTDVQAAHAAGMKVVIYASKPLEGADGHTDTFSLLPDVIASV